MNQGGARSRIRFEILAGLACLCCGCGACADHCGSSPNAAAIPDRYPLGAVNRAHYHTMETNGEAADFILHQNEFVGNTADLTSTGKDHILEVAARARCVPFPIIIERSEYNASPELDEQRRRIISQVLLDCGILDAHQRTFVAPAYGPGLTSHVGEDETAAASTPSIR